jgi:hypothetical protein
MEVVDMEVTGAPGCLWKSRQVEVEVEVTGVSAREVYVEISSE